VEFGRFGEGSNELGIHDNGVVMLHVPATIVPLFFLYFFPSSFPFLPSSSSSFVFLSSNYCLKKHNDEG
jgi:hypothetical protein